MRSKRALIAIGILTFVIGLAVLFPARVAYRWAAPPGISVAGLSGTIWSGEAREASVSGVYLHDLQWRMRPWRLFAGAVDYAIDAKSANGFIEGDLSAGFGGKLAVRNLTAALPLSSFEPLLAFRGVDGNASLNFERLELSDGVPVAADGILQVANLRVPIIVKDSLGGYKAEFSTQSEGINASVEDTDGVVDLAASLKIGEDRSYEFVGLVVAKPTTPDGLREQLRFLAPPNERGQQEIRVEGSF